MIEIKKLSFSYKVEPVLKDLNLTIQSRGMTLLSGANGRGKTTLLKLLAGVMKPTSGEILFDGLPINGVKVSRLASLRSVAPQRRDFDLAFTVEEMLSIVSKPLENKSEILSRLEIDPLLKSRITELSLGQQQRVSVALALLQESNYYLLDEPFSAQDSHFEFVMVELLRDIAKKKGVLVISHHTDSVHTLFDFSITL